MSALYLYVSMLLISTLDMDVNFGYEECQTINEAELWINQLDVDIFLYV